MINYKLCKKGGRGNQKIHRCSNKKKWINGNCTEPNDYNEYKRLNQNPPSPSYIKPNDTSTPLITTTFNSQNLTHKIHTS